MDQNNNSGDQFPIVINMVRMSHLSEEEINIVVAKLLDLLAQDKYYLDLIEKVKQAINEENEQDFLNVMEQVEAYSEKTLIDIIGKKESQDKVYGVGEDPWGTTYH